jgi:hypothetical protein
VQINDEIRKCVVFLGCRCPDEIKFGGTGFFVSVDLPDCPGRGTAYLVTARHNIYGIEKNSVDGKVLLRVNMKDGTTQTVEIETGAWIHKPKGEPYDVAAVPVNILPGLDHLCYPSGGFLTDALMQEHDLGVGDEVFFPGLFTQRMGRKRNIPIVRVGNIAAMPEETVRIKGGEHIEAYLLEGRSIGGLSGSPVFINVGPWRLKKGGLHTTKGPMYYLLGIIHGHYDEKKKEDAAADSAVEDSFPSDSINMGLAVAAPAKHIAELLHHPTFVEDRKNAARAYLDSQSPTLD